MFRRTFVVCLALVASLSGLCTVAAADTTTQFGGLSIEQVSAGPFVIRSLFGGQDQCLDADANNGLNGTKVQVWTCTGSDQQRWNWNGDGQVVNVRFPRMCLDASGGRNGSVVHLWKCDSGLQQQKWFTQPGDLAIYNRRYFNNGNTVLDRDASFAGDGAQVRMWAKNFQSQQWWRPE